MTMIGCGALKHNRKGGDNQSAVAPRFPGITLHTNVIPFGQLRDSFFIRCGQLVEEVTLFGSFPETETEHCLHQTPFLVDLFQ